ncbi:MAG: hypothetical protein KC912_24840 [Proteobacteria bacterium]|nr:hypothetical protein [Pseudomonadota bacterium]
MTARLVPVLLLVACGSSPEPATPEVAEAPDAAEAVAAVPAPTPEIEVVYVMASRLRMRPEPRSDTATWERLPINTKLRKLGTKGDWVEVTAPDGRSGFVHADFVAAEPLMLDQVPAKMEAAEDDAERLSWSQRAAALAPRDARALERLADAYEATGDAKKAAKVRAVVAELKAGFEGWFPEEHAEFDRISAAMGKARAAADVLSLYNEALKVTDAISEPLNTVFLYGEPTVDGASDVIRERVPWGYLTFYAEGTHAALELRNEVWLEAAKRSPEALDDDFLALEMLAYDQVSGRGWAAWQQREWDYGGCSPFGNGKDLHLRILLAADPLRGHPTLGERVDEVRADVLRDIEQPAGAGEFPYCKHMGEPTSIAGLTAEADKLLAQVKLTDAEKAMLERRKSENFGVE